jgi:AbrB family transcriptional regulator (stage V sporulation protein T)
MKGINDMKATGIVRRIDDLGRVVIPKEIRRTMRIREGDPLEIYTDRDGEVIFKKYSPIGELAAFSSQYADTLHKTCDLMVIIADRDAVIASAGVSKKEYNERRLSDEFEKIIENRSLYVCHDDKGKIPVITDNSSHSISCAMPVISDGDLIGAVATVIHNSTTGFTGPSELEIKLVQTAASFLGKQQES